MTKYSLITGAIILSILASCSYDAKEILSKSFEKCQQVQNGYYEMTRFVKFTGDSDTAVSTIKGFFNKIQNDSFSSSAFHYKEFYTRNTQKDKIHVRENLYTGAEYVEFSEDSIAKVISATEWPQRVKTSFYSTVLYTPFTNQQSLPLYNVADLTKNKIQLQLLEPEIISGTKCYHLKMNRDSMIIVDEFNTILSEENHVWIRQEDFIPMQYSTFSKNLLYGDTVNQYEKFMLNTYEINTRDVAEMLSIKSIPANYRIVRYRGVGSPITE